MGSQEKLRKKLHQGSIDARDLRTLLRQDGWVLDRTSGSHEVWKNKAKTFILATHSKDLKRYQIKLAQKMLEED